MPSEPLFDDVDTFLLFANPLFGQAKGSSKRGDIFG
jgi:hypothetical protein